MIIYCDMDAVLTDFIGDVRKVKPDMGDWEPDEVLWPVVKSIPNFWENMSWMPDGKELWDYLARIVPNTQKIILSAPTRNDVRSPSGKMIWIHRELGFNTHYVFTRSSRKKLLARPGDVLIDDLEDTVKDWRRLGGIGIHHTSAANTIKTIEDILKVRGE
jgi:hypothetical protein